MDDDNQTLNKINNPLDIGTYQGSFETPKIMPKIHGTPKYKPEVTPKVPKLYTPRSYLGHVSKPEIIPAYHSKDMSNSNKLKIPQNIINSFYDQKGVSPLLIEQLYRFNNQ